MSDPERTARTADAPDGPESDVDRESSERADDRSRSTGGRAGRDVVVPMRIYKTVTVFSTLIAAFAVVFGFLLLDAATLQAGFLHDVVTWLAGVVGLALASDVLSALFAIAGLCSIAFGAGVYILGSRFRAEGMRNSQEDSAEDSGNG